MRGKWVYIQYYLSIVLLPLVVVALLYFGYLGITYWVDVKERPDALKKASLHLDGVGDVLVAYPKSLQLNAANVKHIELEFTPLQPPTQASVIVVAFEESSDYIRLVPEVVDLPLTVLPSNAPFTVIQPRDFDRPPPTVDVVVTATEPESGTMEQATIRLTIDNILWRVAAALGVVSGAVAFVGTVLGLRKLLRP